MPQDRIKKRKGGKQDDIEADSANERGMANPAGKKNENIGVTQKRENWAEGIFCWGGGGRGPVKDFWVAKLFWGGKAAGKKAFGTAMSQRG